PPLERQLLEVDDDRVHEPMRTSAARWPLHTAPSIVAGRPVSTQSPASRNRRTPVRVTGRAGCPGASENVARGSRTTDARVSAVCRRPGTAFISSSCAAATSSSFVRDRTEPAPLDTSDTYDRPVLNISALSNAHWNVLPGRPMNGSASPPRSNHRLTVTIGDA